jgi:hypothetical protein
LLYKKYGCEKENSETYVPRGRSEKAFGIVMEAIAVAANEENLILNILRSAVFQQVNLVRKPLPLTLLPSDLKCVVAFVRAIDQSEVRANLAL